MRAVSRGPVLRSRRELWPLAGLALLALAACGDGAAGDDDDDAADAGPDGSPGDGGAEPAPPEPPAEPGFVPCPEGWREAQLPDDAPVVTCDPWPTGGRIDCADDEAHFPGAPGCEPIGTRCPAGDWAEDLPDDGGVLFVRAQERTPGASARAPRLSGRSRTPSTQRRTEWSSPSRRGRSTRA